MRFFVLLLAGCASSAAPASTVSDSATTADTAPLPPHSVNASFGATGAPLEHAFFGTRDGKLHIEVIHGGTAECPTMTTPTPDRTVVIAGIAEPFAAARAYADGVRASLLDFKGTLTKEPILRATAVTVSPRLSSAELVVFDLDATFPGGAIAGTVHARHCASMD